MSGLQIKLEGEGERRVVEMLLASGHRLWMVLEPFSIRDAARWTTRTAELSDNVLRGFATDEVLARIKEHEEKAAAENHGEKAALAMGDFIAAHIADWEVRKQEKASEEEGKGEWVVTLKGKPTGAEIAEILNVNVRNLAIISKGVYRAQTLEGDVRNLEK